MRQNGRFTRLERLFIRRFRESLADFMTHLRAECERVLCYPCQERFQEATRRVIDATLEQERKKEEEGKKS